ncbi:Hypothetical protein NTJ_01668 [Nesidiocoris tenuis]|uniref:Uncharacterized protein n=1 Tax=Nesidiocoris tenuis TaxID=355587 RepID=A0ABN7ADD3_9HEMI|nr:Hypothetical protein NTJ_01668 [Nesidiocoris tenuis]
MSCGDYQRPSNVVATYQQRVDALKAERNELRKMLEKVWNFTRTLTLREMRKTSLRSDQAVATASWVSDSQTSIARTGVSSIIEFEENLAFNDDFEYVQYADRR